MVCEATAEAFIRNNTVTHKNKEINQPTNAQTKNKKK